MTPGHELYETIGRVMRSHFGPEGRVDHLPWEKMDGGREGPMTEKAAWEQIAKEFLDANTSRS